MVILSTGSIWPYGLNRIFAIAQKSGFSGVELMVRPKKYDAYRDTWDANYLLNLQEKFNVNIVSLHAPFDFKESQNDFSTLIELAQAVGATNMVIHVPRLGQKKYIDWFENEYWENVDDYPITVAAENIVGSQKRAEPTYKTIEQLKKLPHLVYDTAYSLKINNDPIATLSELDNVAELHISHWDEKEEHMGIMDHQELYSKIINLGKTDLVCLELCPKAFPSIKDEEKIVAMLDKTRQFLENI